MPYTTEWSALGRESIEAIKAGMARNEADPPSACNLIPHTLKLGCRALKLRKVGQPQPASCGTTYVTPHNEQTIELDTMLVRLPEAACAKLLPQLPLPTHELLLHMQPLSGSAAGSYDPFKGL